LPNIVHLVSRCSSAGKLERVNKQHAGTTATTIATTIATTVGTAIGAKAEA